MKHSSHHKAPRGLLTLKALSPLARAGVKGRGRKPRKSVPLDGVLHAPTKSLEQHDASDVETYQDAATTRVVGVLDPWGTEEVRILQPELDGKSFKETSIRLNVKLPRPKFPRKRGRKKLPLSREEKRQREQQQTRKRSRTFYNKLSATKKKLRQAIQTARTKLPREVMQDVQLRKKAIWGIANKVLTPYLNSKKAPERKAAEQVKGQMEQQLSVLNI